MFYHLLLKSEITKIWSMNVSLERSNQYLWTFIFWSANKNWKGVQLDCCCSGLTAIRPRDLRLCPLNNTTIQDDITYINLISCRFVSNFCSLPTTTKKREKKKRDFAIIDRCVYCVVFFSFDQRTPLLPIFR